MSEIRHTGIDPRQFRNALGRFASGVTVVTTVHEDTVYGMTANAFVSVSLDPPLVLVSADNRSTWHEKVSQSRRYGVSVLSEEQDGLSNRFAGRPGEHASEVPFAWKDGLPLLRGAVAHFVCRVVDAHPAGDHTLHVGHVEHLGYEDGKPLLFYAGKYGALKVDEAKVWENSFWFLWEDSFW